MQLLGCVRKAGLRTHGRAQRGDGTWGIPNHTLPGCSQPHHRSHQPIRGPSPPGRGSTASRRQTGAPIKGSEGGTASPGPPRAVPQSHRGDSVPETLPGARHALRGAGEEQSGVVQGLLWGNRGVRGKKGGMHVNS